MRTGLTVTREQDGIKFYGEISAFDIDRIYLKLDRLDRALLNDSKFNDPPEDYLLVMEMLFRRIHELK